MAIFRPLSKEEIKRTYTHYGMFCFIAPVYLNLHDNEVAVRNWYPDWLLDVALFAFDVFCFMQQMVDPEFECGWPIRITGKIDL